VSAGTVRVVKPGSVKVPVANGTAEKVQTNAFVPPKSVADGYVHREILGQPDFEVFDYCLEKNWNMLLRGDTGSGKTLVGEAFAAEREMFYYSVPCDVSIDPTSLFGKMMPDREIGKFRWQDGPVTQLVRHGGVLNISEVNMVPPRIASSLYSLLDHRRCLMLIGHEGEVVRAHENLLIIADMNPNYRGTQPLNDAFKNRFPVKLEWGYDPLVENRLLTSSKLLEMAQKLRKDRTNIATPVPTNLLMEFERIATRFGMKFAEGVFLESFTDSERSAVQRVFDLHSVEIADDVKGMRTLAGFGEPDTVLNDPAWESEDWDYGVNQA
jgi:nitric oxide reductase NorQ protein